MENVRMDLAPNLVEGFDIGNAFANFGEIKFATKVRVGKLLNVGQSREEVHQITYNGLDYIVGEGKTIMGENKYYTDAYKICLLTAIALRGGRRRNIRAKICIGLPILNHERKADEVRKIIEDWGTQEIWVDGSKYIIDIVELDVFIEGALPVLQEDSSHQLTIDIGGGTVNVIEWKNMCPIKYDTFDSSITNVYSTIAQYLNLRHGGSFTTSDVEDIVIENKQTTFIKQVKIDISEIYQMISEFVDGVMASMEEAKFKVNQVEKISIFGGGSYTTSKYFKKHLPQAIIVPEAQFVNSKVFKLVAKM